MALARQGSGATLDRHEVMNKTTTILLCIALLILRDVSADEGPGPDAYVFATTSPSNLFYAVQSFGLIPTNGPQEARARFQVFSTETGALKWECSKLFGTQPEIMLADDGEHIIQLPYWVLADGTALMTMRGKDVPDANKLQLAEQFKLSVSGLPVVVFYKRDKIIQKVLLHDLAIPLDRIRDVSVTHVRVHAQSFSPFYTSDWSCTPQCESWIRAESKTIFAKYPTTAGNTITITFVDGRARTFDYTTGQLLKTEETSTNNRPPSPIDVDPFSGKPPIRQPVVQPGDAPNPHSPSAQGAGGR